LPAAVIVASLALVVVPVAAVHRDRARGNVGSVIVTADAAAALIVRAVEAVARIVVIPTRPVGPAAVRWRLAAVEPAVGVVHPAVDVAPVIAITVAVEVTEAAAVGVAVRAVVAPLPVVRVVAVVARVA